MYSEDIRNIQCATLSDFLRVKMKTNGSLRGHNQVADRQTIETALHDEGPPYQQHTTCSNEPPSNKGTPKMANIKKRNGKNGTDEDILDILDNFLITTEPAKLITPSNADTTAAVHHSSSTESNVNTRWVLELS